MIHEIPLTPLALPDPGRPPVGSKTLSRWNQFLGAIAAGEGLPESMLKYFISRADIEACVRSDPIEYEKWNGARLAANRKLFTALVLEDIFGAIAGGATIKEALAAAGVEGAHNYRAFNKLVALDQEIHKQFLDACKARSMHMSDEVLEIADDDTNDVLSGDKGPVPNNAAVNRSKLRAEMRMRLMGAYNAKLFGEKKGGDVNVAVQVNHAATLEAARSRRDTRGVKLSASRIRAAIDAEVIVPEKSAEDTSWLEAPAATDTSWLG